MERHTICIADNKFVAVTDGVPQHRQGQAKMVAFLTEDGKLIWVNRRYRKALRA